MTDPKPTLPEAVQLGLRPGLEAMRDTLATAMTEAEPAVVAQIAGRLQAVMDRLDELSEPEEATPFDVLAARRQARLAGTDAAAPANRKVR